jgi:cytoplasmic iron level regulating protein YaaA (DUF328/UPF0246 family)
MRKNRMLSVLSPSKTLNEHSAYNGATTTPVFTKDTAELVQIMKDYDVTGIRALMDVSDAIATLNVARYQGWENAQSYAALHLFKGDVYEAMDAEHYTPHTLDFAQKHLRILSGLFGLLRPLDAMHPYRLEMGIRLPNPRGKDLYAFWAERITLALNEALRESGSDILINLASQEYFKAVKPKSLNGHLIHCDFLVKKEGKIRSIGLFAKRARGAMAHYILTHQLNTPEALLSFDSDGYRYDAGLSAEKKDTYVFVKEIN